jgi:hypothetical protein
VEIEDVRQIILQGGPTIQTMVSQKGYVLAWGQLWNDHRVTPKPLAHVPAIGKV